MITEPETVFTREEFEVVLAAENEYQDLVKSILHRIGVINENRGDIETVSLVQEDPGAEFADRSRSGGPDNLALGNMLQERDLYDESDQPTHKHPQEPEEKLGDDSV